MDKLIEAVRGIKSGKEESFRELYDLTNKTALAVIRRYCDVSGDYEDILQETYIKVYKSIKDLENEDKAQAWINKIAANTAIRHNMKKRPTLFTEMADEEGQIPDFEDENENANPEAVADKKAVTSIINEVMKSLPEDQRDALWMVYGQRISIREMAESLGISENTIKSRLFQGRKKLLARKEDFRRLGIEISIIPVSVLVSVAYNEEVYAATAASAAGTGYASGKVFSEIADKLKEKSGSTAAAAEMEGTAAATGIGGAAGSVGTAGAEGIAGAAAAGKIGTAIAGMSIGAKAAVAGVAAVALVGGGAVIVSHGSSDYMEPIEEKIEAYNDRDFGIAEQLSTFYPEEFVNQVTSWLETSEDSLSAYYGDMLNAGGDANILFVSDKENFDRRYGSDWQIKVEKVSAERIEGEELEDIADDYSGKVTDIPESSLIQLIGGDRDAYESAEEYLSGISVTDAYDLVLKLTIDGSEGQGESEAKACVVNYGGDWVLYRKPDDLIYDLRFKKTDSKSGTSEAVTHAETAGSEEGLEQAENPADPEYENGADGEDRAAAGLIENDEGFGTANQDSVSETEEPETAAETLPETSVPESERIPADIDGGRANPGDQVQVWKCNEAISLRREPSTSAEVITEIPYGNMINFLSDAENGFASVSFMGHTGYVLKEYLNAYGNELYTNAVGKVVNCNESITLRSTPSTGGMELMQIPLGEEVTFLGNRGDFYEVIYNGIYGYVLASYIYFEPTEQTGRIVNCNESITLRKEPDTSAEEICQIKLNETVYGFDSYGFDFTDLNFVWVIYDGKIGYILGEYLEWTYL